eukprot:11805589-Ditylum_brightwellii.AAC.3
MVEKIYHVTRTSCGEDITGKYMFLVIIGSDGAFDVDDMSNVEGDEEMATNGASKKNIILMP